MNGWRGYRSVQASGMAEREQDLALIASGQQCPGCGLVFRGVHPPSAIPADLPARGNDGRVLRALDLEPTGRRLAERLAAAVTPASFAQFPGTLRLIDATPGRLWLLAPARVASWISDRYGRVLDRAASECAGADIACEIITRPAVDARSLAELLVGTATCVVQG